VDPPHAAHAAAASAAAAGGDEFASLLRAFWESRKPVTPR
jgi:protein-disulfide isomerase